MRLERGGAALRWVTVYDVTKASWVPDWPVVVVGLAFATVGGLMVFWWPTPLIVTRSRAIGVGFVALGLLMGLATTAFDVVSRLSLSDDVRLGKYQRVEGRVANFAAMPQHCHGAESFDVSQTHFAYSDAEMTGGFNHSSACGGGPFRSGQRVRLDYVTGVASNVIVRAEIAE